MASPEIERVLRLTGGIASWLTTLERETLYGFARACVGRGAIVEIGSSAGLSTVLLALGSKDGAGVPVYAIDPHVFHTAAVFRWNVGRLGVDDVVRPIFARSADAAPGFLEPVELLFVDGSHILEDVRLDLELWVPKLSTAASSSCTTRTTMPARAPSRRSSSTAGASSATCASSTRRPRWRRRPPPRPSSTVCAIAGACS